MKILAAVLVFVGGFAAGVAFVSYLMGGSPRIRAAFADVLDDPA